MSYGVLTELEKLKKKREERETELFGKKETLTPIVQDVGFGVFDELLKLQEARAESRAFSLSKLDNNEEFAPTTNIGGGGRSFGSGSFGDDIAPVGGSLYFQPIASSVDTSNFGKLNLDAPVKDDPIRTGASPKGVASVHDYKQNEDWTSVIIGGKNASTVPTRVLSKEEKAENWINWLAGNVNAGTTAITTSAGNTLDATIGNILKGVGWENNPISKFNEGLQSDRQMFLDERDKAAKNLGLGKGAKVVQDLTEGTIAAVPMALEAMFTAGANLIPTAASLTDDAILATGTLLQKAGLKVSSMMKNPQYWMSFVQSYGNDYKEAKESGASETTATLTATLKSLINSGIEIGIDGGSGMQGLLDDVAKGGKKLLKWVESSVEEGMEEVVQGFISRLISKVSYDDEVAVLDAKQAGTEFAMGTAIGGILGGGQMLVSNAATNQKKPGTKSLTEFEQRVVSREVENRIAEEEKSGGKVSKKDRAKIEEDVVRMMEKGTISIDTIEEILGGETFTSYQDTVKSEDAEIKRVEDQIKKLENAPNTVGNSKKYDSLQNRLEELKKNSTRDQLKSKLGEEVYGLVQNEGGRLMESYRERDRRGQAFTADVEKYTDPYARKTVQNLIDSGIANNTNITHDFADMLAKLSQDKKISFSFTNNARLKGSVFGVNGRNVNGYVTKDGVTVNLNSRKALNSVVGHEITHVLEGTEFYDQLQSALFEYAESKGEYQSRYDAIAKLYENIEGTSVEAELTADLVGDYLFTDKGFIERLSVENRGVFQKLWDEVKYMCRVATAGSKEARQLEKVKKVFEDAYRATKNTAVGGVKYSIAEPFTDSNGTQFDNAVLLDTDFFDGEPPRKWGDKLKKEVYSRASTDPFILPIVDENGNTTLLQFANPNDRVTKDGASNHKVLDKLSSSSDNISKLAVVHIDEIVSVSEENSPYYTSENDHQWLDKNGWLHRNANVINKRNGNIYNLTFDIAKAADGRTILYATDGKIKKVGNVNVNSLKIKGSRQNSDFDTKVAQDGGKVNGEFAPAEVSEAQNGRGLDMKSEVQFSLSRDTEYMDNAIAANNSMLRVSSDTMSDAKVVRERVASRMNEIKDRGLVGLPEDIEGNTYIANSSYDGTEENTTICPRSLAAEAFTDAVSEYLGRPLTVEEQIYISQDLQGRSLTPECTYCYVATDRKAYRAFLGEYINQRDTVIEKVKENPNADFSRTGDLYKEFLGGRKDTAPMYARFKMWVDAYRNGKPMVDASNLANISKLMGDINSTFGAELKPQIVDAMKYAQSASWAKKRVNYVAYNGHILKWKQARIDKLNSHYGLRMYSFSDFHPAFVLENMQMITDASVRGLKMLGYTKDTDFVEIFAPSGMNINVSTFGFEAGGNVYENNIIGAEWDKAKALREQYPNVGVTFVATNDHLVNWALDQDWIDVVIPYHLVRTGAEVAKAFGYTNYTSESADTKKADWAKGKDEKYIAPTEHNNDKATYMAALEKNHLNPRFERFVDNPNYMKLVNECRQPASKSKPVQPVFNESAAMVALAKLEANGYYQPIGGSVERMYEIAAEVAEDMGKQLAPDAKYSLSETAGESRGEYGDYNVYGEDVALDIGPVAESVQSDQRGVAPYEDGWRESFDALTDEDAPPDPTGENVAPEEEEAEYQRQRADSLAGSIKPEKVSTREQKAQNYRNNIESLRNAKEESLVRFNEEIAAKESEYKDLKRKNTYRANKLLRQIEDLKLRRDNTLADFDSKISNANVRLVTLENTPPSVFERAERRQALQESRQKMFEELVGDTSTWKDKALGLSYKTNTLRRNLRDVVRDSEGNRDIEKADAIYDVLQGDYNHHEAQLNRRATQIKSQFSDMDINRYEDVYIQMLGELRHNPDTSLTEGEVMDYLAKHEKKIDQTKVDQVIQNARKVYDDLYTELNAVLREQGMKEIPYRKGYFPHFTEPKQNWLAKAFNWKVRDDSIPTDIAGLTEDFKPNRTWQSFNKERTTDLTDYSFKKGMDMYVQGALDWIYHISDIQTNRAFENYLRYIHSDTGVKEKIDAINTSDQYTAEEAQELVDLVYKEAKNPLNNFVTDLRTRTNTLAGKKSSMDRGMEAATNRKIYSVVNNVSNRVMANMVAGSISSALTNFIPITQSWGQVSPVQSLDAMGETIASWVRDDGVVDKSDFLTNRLRQADKLYKAGWDKASGAASALMGVVDNFASQTVWRSKYRQNLSKGMSESQAVKDADQFAENVIGGRSRGNMPTIFDSKNPLTKVLTAFQLEVSNQYGYLFKDMPQDMRNEAKAKLVIGYAGIFLGAYGYNALYSALTGRYAAFDPVRIIQELIGDLWDEDEEELDIVGAGTNLLNNVLEETPFIGGLLGGGRIPISSVLPYENPYDMVVNTAEGLGNIATNIQENWGDWEAIKAANEDAVRELTNEWLNPVYYGVLPFGGGQLRKTIQGLNMFSDEHPVAGSYTDSGNLRFPVEDTPWNRVKAGLFGQWASENARDYFDNERKPLKENQVEEFMASGMKIQDYWDYREGLSEYDTLEEKVDYIAGLDLPTHKKNMLVNNIAGRKEAINLVNYDQYSGLEEMDFAMKYPEKYEVAQAIGYVAYRGYQAGMKGMKLSEKADYISRLNLTTEQKNLLINSETDRKEPIDLEGYENYSSFEEFEFAKKNPEKYALAKAVGGYDAYSVYSDALGDITAARDEWGQSVNGTRKPKVYEYIYGLDIPEIEKHILFKSEYTSTDDHNIEIIEYLNDRDDISYDEMVSILLGLGFKVSSDGVVRW